ncbi:MAG: aminoglycoside phosphotransferase family protein [Acidipropionibacterium sp.]|nr:aminoglycoside phosphotransferase family protein [Acidipropionibacterium sp.]
MVVMADLGSGPSLADLLAGSDGDAALEAASMWGRDSARLLTASRDAVPRFCELVRQADPGSRSAGGPASPRLPARGLATLCARLGVSDGVAEQATAEVALLGELAGRDGSRVCSQADPAPDNLLVASDPVRNSIVGGGAAAGGDDSAQAIIAIDYEAASYHHIAVDLLGLMVPWPASGLLAATPGEFQEAVISGFGSAHEGLADLLDDPDLDRMTGLAAMSVALQMTELTLEPLIRREDVGRFSGGRSRLVTLWRAAADHTAAVTPTLSRLCNQAAETAVGAWEWPGSLPMYPCFGRS